MYLAKLSSHANMTLINKVIYKSNGIEANGYIN